MLGGALEFLLVSYGQCRTAMPALLNALRSDVMRAVAIDDRSSKSEVGPMGFRIEEHPDHESAMSNTSSLYLLC